MLETYIPPRCEINANNSLFFQVQVQHEYPLRWIRKGGEG